MESLRGCPISPSRRRRCQEIVSRHVLRKERGYDSNDLPSLLSTFEDEADDGPLRRNLFTIIPSPAHVPAGVDLNGADLAFELEQSGRH
jgi:hypothetical protein